MAISASGPTFSLGDLLGAVGEARARAPRDRRAMKVNVVELSLRSVQLRRRRRGTQMWLRLFALILALRLSWRGRVPAAPEPGELRPDRRSVRDRSPSSVCLIARSVLTAAPPVLLLATAGTIG